MLRTELSALTRGSRAWRLTGACAASALALSGCVTPVAGPDGLYAHPIGTAPVTSNATPYSPALVCLSQYARQYGVHAPRIAVGRIADYTGKAEDNGGREVTQGASLMAMSSSSSTRRSSTSRRAKAGWSLCSWRWAR